MTREETKAMLAVLKAGYPNFYKELKKPDAEQIIDLWATMFADNLAPIVIEAVKSLMCTLKYPPTIADVKEKIALITQPAQLTEMEAWNTVRRAMSYYNAQASFDNLPPILQKLVGSPNQLREWAIMEADVVDSVIQSNFMRSYKARVQSEKELTALPESTKDLMQQLAEGFSMDRKRIGDT
jgi:hypothetical protein